MKKSYLLLGMLMLAFVGCSSSDEEFMESEETETTQKQTDEPTFTNDIYSVDYILKNENGEKTSIFKKGENIIFDVTIKNTTGKEISVGDERTILGGAMSVYRSNDEFVGNPWNDVVMTLELRMKKIEAYGTWHLSCPWRIDTNLLSSSPIKVFPVMDSLPVGDYFSMMKCRVLKSNYPGEITGYDDIELKIPFTVVE